MDSLLHVAIVLGVLAGLGHVIKGMVWEKKRKERKRYYTEDYLKSDAWQRKRYVVLKRDHWKCVYCGANATQVHHKKYARKNIGEEPIKWLISVCETCHQAQHS